MSKQKIFVRNVPDEPATPPVGSALPDDNSMEFDVEKLLSKGGEILRREVSNLMMESSRGKLAPNSARDLVAYIKLLSELKEAQAKELDSMTDEELAQLVKK